jgi:hypothetical protein
MVLSLILIEATTKLCHCATWVEKPETLGDIRYICVSLDF